MHLLATGSFLRAVGAQRSLASPRPLYSHLSSQAPSTPPATTSAPQTIHIGTEIYPTDSYLNVPATILSHLPRRLHTLPDHPISITRALIESRFPSPAYTTHNLLPPVVSVHQNFDSLGFSPNHPGRSRTDTYYINRDTVLRTHTSAHQADLFRLDPSPGFLISADVYRRDAIDRSHYPVFHQMEGARMFDRRDDPDVARAVNADLASLPVHNLMIEDPNPPFHSTRNPLQTPDHTAEEATALVSHLKHSLELVVAAIFSSSQASSAGPLKVRWIEATFPFTSPSYEMEVFFNGEWLEILGCGIVKQSLPNNAGQPSKLGWAFGLGLERIAMILFGIPDIRLFWSRDPRFLDQFKAGEIARFKEFSKHPACYKDISFWLPTDSEGREPPFHENDMHSLVRDVAGDAVEDVKLTDRFTDKKTGRESVCFRVNYRMLSRTMTNEEANALHEGVRKGVEGLGEGYVLR